jgi:hypothetical protein
MWRTALGSVVGTVAGVGCAALILRVTYAVVAQMKEQTFEIEPSTTYLTVTLGAGFGSLCGALAGFASAILREWRKNRASNSPP